MKPFVYRWLLPLGAAIVCAIVLWIFVGNHVYRISGRAMFPFADDGDWVYAEKPDDIQCGDILLIGNPLDYRHSSPRISYSRCIATPGSKVQIYSKRLYVNDELQQGVNISFDAEVLLLNEADKRAAVDRYKLVPENQILTNTKYVVSQNLFNRMVSDSVLPHVRQSVLPVYLYDDKLFPFSHQFNFNKDFFGPVVVPSKGMKIKLTPSNYLVYKFLFLHAEKTKVEHRDGIFYVDGIKSDSYTFKHDYFFMLNDYRDDPSDSRTYGPVADDEIVARVSSVIF
ncbi:MAG: hypothetical protein J5882_06845 [Bacteroidales bacterium]|nr:hypothetical protein [Bacteroidales bacterium]